MKKSWVFSLATALLLTSNAVAGPTLDLLAQGKLPETSAHNQLALIFYSAPKRIDWTTPGSMARAAIKNTMSGDAHPLAHIDTLLSCEGHKPILAGMSRSKDPRFKETILLGGRSMDLLTDSFEGHMILEEEGFTYIPKSLETNRINILTIDISESACKRLLTYHKQYRQQGFDKTYAGFDKNPFRGQGAGCAAFGMSNMVVAGLLEQKFRDAWSLKLDIPKRLIRTPGHPADIDFWGFMLGMDSTWAKNGEPAVHVTAYDPDLMHAWLAKMWAKPELLGEKSLQTSLGKNLEIEIDRRKTKTPTDNYWEYAWPPK